MRQALKYVNNALSECIEQCPSLLTVVGMVAIEQEENGKRMQRGELEFMPQLEATHHQSLTTQSYTAPPRATQRLSKQR